MSNQPVIRLDREDAMDAISRGVYDAIKSLMDPMGGHPMTREDVLDVIKEGTEKAMAGKIDWEK
jgi:hypothetical protein